MRSPICPPNKLPKINAHVVETPNQPHSMAEKNVNMLSKLALQPLNTPRHMPPLNATKPKFTSLKQWQKSAQRVSRLESDRPPGCVGRSRSGNSGLSENRVTTSRNDTQLSAKCIQGKVGTCARTICVDVAKSNSTGALDDASAVDISLSDGANHIPRGTVLPWLGHQGKQLGSVDNVQNTHASDVIKGPGTIRKVHQHGCRESQQQL